MKSLEMRWAPRQRLDVYLMVDLAPDRQTLDRLAEVASQKRPADLVLRGGTVVDVSLVRLVPDCSLAVSAGRIVALGELADRCIGPTTYVLNCDGLVVSPGLIEPHTHCHRLNLSELARLQVKSGVTTTILDVSELTYVAGMEAFRLMLAEARSAPGRVMLTVPPLIGADSVHEAQISNANSWIEFLDEPGVVGVGESYWAQIMRGHPRTQALIAAALRRGLAVEGHAAGARLDKINALVAMGIGSDHEAISAQDAIDRLGLGLYVYVRCGATRDDLGLLADLPDWARQSDHLALCTDGVDPSDLSEGNSLNRVVEEAIRDGLPFVSAVRMSTAVPSRRFGFAPWLGALTPGALADIVVLSSDANFRPVHVFVGGSAPRETAAPQYPKWVLDTVRVPKFDPHLLSHPGRGRWRAIEIAATEPLVTREIESEGENTLVVAAIDRIGTDRIFRGLLKGLGLRGASFASSAGPDSRVVLVVGDNASDMEVAIKTVVKMRGGICIVSDGTVAAHWQAHLGGQLSLEAAGKVSNQLKQIDAVLARFGCRLPNALVAIDSLTSPAVPHLRISAEGYFRVRDGACLPLEWQTRT